MRKCKCDETEVCFRCAENGTPYKDQLLKMHKSGNITINHFFKAKDLEDPLSFVCKDSDCQYCRNR